MDDRTPVEHWAGLLEEEFQDVFSDIEGGEAKESHGQNEMAKRHDKGRGFGMLVFQYRARCRFLKIRSPSKVIKPLSNFELPGNRKSPRRYQDF